jgi:tetratricopeptide (TPR) repeat protein
MSRLRHTALIIVFTCIATVASGQVRGDGRINGKVVDEQKQPMQDVVVKATLTGQNQPLQAKTNKKGEWTINGLASGEWTIEFSKDGFDSQKGTVKIDEGNNPGPITVTLAKATPKVDPNVEISEAAQKAQGLMQAGKFAEARKIFEDLLAKYPQVFQINAYIAQAYAGEKNYDKAVEHLKIASDKDPSNAEIKLLLGDILMEKGDKAEGLQILQSVDIAQVKNPYPLINASITLINDGKADDALATLNKIAAQFPNQADVYYYRGRANIAAKKMPEAKADLEKFVSMAPPDSAQLADAKKILEQIKDIK